MKIYDEQETAIRTETAQADQPEVSVFLPVFNEEPNLRPLHAKLDEALKALGRSAEIVYVDDGSSDGSLKILRELAEAIPEFASSRSAETMDKLPQWPPGSMPPAVRF
jgi:cellulose synthase/poly-beta-1,6-N-acetylglucosamine synthase-like glycosyltransferase